MTGTSVKGIQMSANLPTIQSVTLSPNAVVGGASSLGTVNISLGKGETVLLSSSNPSVASVPASIVISKGSTSGTFNITTTPVAANTTVTITATLNGTFQTTLTVIAPTVSALSLNPNSVTGGSPSTGTVTISGNAPTGGIAVALSSSNTPAATVPASVTVPAGQNSANFTVTTLSVSSTTTSIITATLGGSQTAVLTVNASVVLSAFTINPSTVTGGSQNSTGTVTLNSPAPSGGSSVTLSSSNSSVASVPASVAVAAGNTTANFTITSFSVGSTTAVTITAVLGVTLTATLTVNASSGTTAGDTLPNATGTGWSDLPNTSPCSLGTANFPSGVTCSQGANDWSSGFYDKSRKQLVWVGWGHTGGCDNAFYAIQLDGNPAFLKRLDMWSAGSATGGTYADGSPQTGHTYDGVVYVPPTSANGPDSFIQTNEGVCTTAGGLGNSSVVRLSNIAAAGPTNTVSGSSWVAVGTPNNGYYGGGDFDPNTSMVYSVSGDNSSGASWMLTTINPSNGAVTVVENGHGLCYQCTMIVDPDLRKMYGFGPNVQGVNILISAAIIAWDINPAHAGTTYGIAAAASASGCPTFTNDPGADWDPVAHLIVIWNSNGNPTTNNLVLYNPDTVSHTEGSTSVPAGSCVTITPSGNGPVAGTVSNGTFKRFRYVDYCDCFVILNNDEQDAFIVRTRPHLAPNSFTARSTGTNVPGGATSIIGTQNFDGPVILGASLGGQLEGVGATNTTAGWTQDTTNFADGGSSWRCNVAAGQQSCTDYFRNFGGPTNFPNGVGLGGEFYFQFREYFGPNFIGNSNWPSGEGYKTGGPMAEEDRNGYIAPSCSTQPDEVVINARMSDALAPMIYTHCPPINLMQYATVGSDFLDQIPAGCVHYGGRGAGNAGEGDPGCWFYHAGEWFTFQEHVKVAAGGWNTCCSTVEVWASHAGQPSRLIIQSSQWILGNDNPASSLYGKLWLNAFNTGNTGAVQSTWADFDDLIISKRRIPDPDVGVPNAPDSITATINSQTSVTLNWRVNSNNGTAQDDTGFSVERCSPTNTGHIELCFTGLETFSVVGTTAAHASSYTDNTVVHGTSYIYRVRAVNSTGNSAYTVGWCQGNNFAWGGFTAQPGTPPNPCGSMVTP